MSTVALVTEALRGRIAAAVAPAAVVVRRPHDFDPAAAAVCLFLDRVSNARMPRSEPGLSVILHYAILFGGDTEQCEPERLFECVAVSLHDNPTLILDSQTLGIVSTNLTRSETATLSGGRGLLACAWDIVGVVLTATP
ncbi:MAG TPA: hypothetical protein VEU30_12765 [Thermoanaerobaculia bacterium]|nr:hypothetical protein [Thermoanaerobaculia bacterium]